MYQITTPLTVSEVLKAAWQLYTASFAYLWVWSLLLSIVFTLPAAFNFIGFYHLDPTGHLHYSWGGLFVGAGLLVSSSYFIQILMIVIEQIRLDEQADLVKAFQVAKNNLINLYFAFLLYSILFFSGLALFILPGLYIWLLLIMFLPFMVFENLSIFESLSGSIRLVNGYWWQTFGVLLIPAFLSFLARNIIRLGDWSGPLTFYGDLVLLTFITPFFYAAVVIQFYNLKVQHAMPKVSSELPRLQS